MKIINSKGRTLLEVTGAYPIIDNKGIADVFYSYSGEISGYGPAAQIQRAFETIKADSPSAHVVGTLPEALINGGLR